MRKLRLTRNENVKQRDEKQLADQSSNEQPLSISFVQMPSFYFAAACPGIQISSARRNSDSGCFHTRRRDLWSSPVCGERAACHLISPRLIVGSSLWFSKLPPSSFSFHRRWKRKNHGAKFFGERWKARPTANPRYIFMTPVNRGFSGWKLQRAREETERGNVLLPLRGKNRGALNSRALAQQWIKGIFSRETTRRCKRRRLARAKFRSESRDAVSLRGETCRRVPERIEFLRGNREVTTSFSPASCRVAIRSLSSDFVSFVCLSVFICLFVCLSVCLFAF